MESFGMSYGIRRASEVAVTGKLTVGGEDVGAKLAALEAEVWCLKECDEAKKGDCRKYACDGATQTCTDAGAQPDGTACVGGVGGKCVDGTCCVPSTTCYLLKACGIVDDGCGGVLSCGGCGDGVVCHNNACCAPQTCDELSK